MDTFKANPEISVDRILSYISQKEIMEYYLGISVDTTRGMFRSPLRQDKNPTCTFAWKGGKLLFRDWAKPTPYDCFGVVMEKYNIGFYDAQKKVAKDFNLTCNIEEGNIEKRDTEVNFSKPSKSNKSKIDVKVQGFTKDNISYLKSYHISSDQCDKFNVYCPKYVWVNDRIRYVQDEQNPALAYYFGLDEKDNQKWKIYFYRKQSGNRFLCNTNRINGWIQLPETAEHLVITKSLKDVICLDIFDIPAIAMQAETQTPYGYIMEELKERFNNIVTLLDYDETGINRTKVLKDKYGVPYYFIKDDKAKDFSDYIKFYGLDAAKQLSQEILCN